MYYLESPKEESGSDRAPEVSSCTLTSVWIFFQRGEPDWEFQKRKVTRIATTRIAHPGSNGETKAALSCEVERMRQKPFANAHPKFGGNVKW